MKSVTNMVGEKFTVGEKYMVSFQLDKVKCTVTDIIEKHGVTYLRAKFDEPYFVESIVQANDGSVRGMYTYEVEYSMGNFYKIAIDK